MNLDTSNKYEVKPHGDFVMFKIGGMDRRLSLEDAVVLGGWLQAVANPNDNIAAAVRESIRENPVPKQTTLI